MFVLSSVSLPAATAVTRCQVRESRVRPTIAGSGLGAGCSAPLAGSQENIAASKVTANKKGPLLFVPAIRDPHLPRRQPILLVLFIDIHFVNCPRSAPPNRAQSGRSGAGAKESEEFPRWEN